MSAHHQRWKEREAYRGLAPAVVQLVALKGVYRAALALKLMGVPLHVARFLILGGVR